MTLLVFLFSCAPQKPDSVFPEDHAAKLEWWKDARFGMFIHWGPVSLKGTEIGWSRGNQIPVSEYDSLYLQFNPVQFNADEWVSIAKAAGMKYIVFTSKHHDGFCNWDTKYTDHNIMNSPFKRDIMAELAEAGDVATTLLYNSFNTYITIKTIHMKRFGQIIGIDPQQFEKYKSYHAAVWPDVLKKITECHISNYSIFHKDGMLFAYMEYSGDDFDADMAIMAADPGTQEWWNIMMPMQRPVANRKEGEWWADMEEVFHLD